MPIFLANSFLWFSLVALIPVALHLFHRHQSRPVPFAALRFLQEAVANSRRSRRLTQGLTLLLRILIVLLLAFAFAQPVMRFHSFLPGNQRTVLLVVDATPSMQAEEGGHTLFEQARSWALQVVEGLEEGTRVALLAPGCEEDSPVYPPVSDKETALAALRNLQPGFAYQNLASLLVDNIAKSQADLDRAEIHFFSDFQKGAWPENVSETLAPKLRKLGIAVFFNHVGEVTSGDAGIVRASFTPPAILAGNGFTANVCVHGNADYSGSTVVALSGDSGSLNQKSLEIIAGEDATTSIPAKPVGEEEQFTGNVSISPDAYPLNNVRYFSLPRLQGIPVLVVHGNSPRDSFFLLHALAPGGQAVSLLTPTELDWETFLATDVSCYRMCFLCNPPSLDSTALDKIRQGLAAGQDIVLFPGDNHAITTTSLRQFSSLAEITADLDEAPEARRIEVTIHNRQHPLCRRLEAMLPPPWGFPARKLLSLSLPADKQGVLLDYASSAFALQVSQDGGKLWVFAAGANRDWSDWPVTPFFFVAMQELARLTASTAGRERSTAVGTPLALPWSGRETELVFQANGPDGKALQLSAGRATLAGPMQIRGFQQPGIYSLESKGKKIRVAVNLAEEELQLSYMDASALPSTLPEVACAVSKNHGELREQMEKLRQGSPLWPMLLVLAFFLAMLELLFANFRSRSRHRPKILGQLLESGGGE